VVRGKLVRRKKEEYSDRQVTVFLIGAIIISLVSTWTVLFSLQEAISVKEMPQYLASQQPSASASSGAISLIILKSEGLNSTVNGTE